MQAAGIHWDIIADSLPVSESQADLDRAREMWDLFNVNDSPGLTVFEVEKGIVDMTQTGDIFDSERAINDAFEVASNVKQEKDKQDMEDKLDFNQFRLFLRILAMTYNFYETFDYIDSDGEHVITKEEFCTDGTRKVLDAWLGPEDDWEERFQNIDLTNKEGEGRVLFTEFLHWAQAKNLEFQGDLGINGEEA